MFERRKFMERIRILCQRVDIERLEKVLDSGLLQILFNDPTGLKRLTDDDVFVIKLIIEKGWSEVARRVTSEMRDRSRSARDRIVWP